MVIIRLPFQGLVWMYMIGRYSGLWWCAPLYLGRSQVRCYTLSCAIGSRFRGNDTERVLTKTTSIGISLDAANTSRCIQIYLWTMILWLTVRLLTVAVMKYVPDDRAEVSNIPSQPNADLFIWPSTSSTS